ncbi:hypothetical protein BJV85_002040 [Clostridium acetobutylicum]|uniref:Uncharacterized protein n=1 Tax=Clostridium acetobutylicum (strain ATCC 824 / DSM 792 / JCM 1419 / IAM 19013 / LMG 5710 / NBRC 13948 / NRRL B-527 / VKM B-1787 / 2291 / W) TaxID=272562 RepID=Q97HR0_CLOAB|nr:hypothetical protein [Clostridium acetobutylicum]AAK79910.1 Hypothetical protein CA_C1948 [Clostridium acetobutylicum ATCC 824]ADZ21002.1 Conserved hypothetical protein [Clostridium acetobutylicum EA 2018]AEI32087.1 hypothetical protein SMB_G1979 [Clostridium acetobutylicum DSM 1731]PSM07618.1 hypothetical protein C7T89_06000 [Clostridium sp. NJ4]AWV79657.1 hypothetical protein DK921_06000 [Clostridium acetobutylicum]
MEVITLFIIKNNKKSDILFVEYVTTRTNYDTLGLPITKLTIGKANIIVNDANARILVLPKNIFFIELPPLEIIISQKCDIL